MTIAKPDESIENYKAITDSDAMQVDDKLCEIVQFADDNNTELDSGFQSR